MDNKQVSEFYDEFADHQANLGVNKRHHSIMRFLKAHGLKQDSAVLEIGAGIGTLTQLVAAHLVEGSITMNDISHRSVEFAKKALSSFSNIQYLAGDILEHDIKDRFDAVIFPDVLEHIPLENHAEIFRRCDLMLNDTGSIYIHIPSPFYIDWLKVNNPGSMQIIDQAVFLEDFVKNISDTTLYIHFLHQYSLFVHGDDYRFLVLKKKREGTFKPIHNPGVRFHKRFIRRIQQATNVLMNGPDI